MKHCPICQSSLDKNEFLSSCSRKTCYFYSWDTQPIIEILSKFSMGQRKWKRNFNKIIKTWDQRGCSNFVYTILLGNQLKPNPRNGGHNVYIGQTGRHPLDVFTTSLGYKSTPRSNVNN